MKAIRFGEPFLRGFLFGGNMESLKDYFDRHASSWDEMLKYNERTSELLEAVSWFGLAEGHWVLDVGTGTGILLPLLSEAIGMEGGLWPWTSHSKCWRWQNFVTPWGEDPHNCHRRIPPIPIQPI